MLIYDCRKLIEFASTFYTLYPGDVLLHRHARGRQPGQARRRACTPRSRRSATMDIPVRAHKPGG